LRAAQTLAPEEVPTRSEFLPGQRARRGDGVVVRDLDHLVHERDVEHLGDEPVADALDLVQARLVPEQGSHVGGLDGHDADLRAVLLEEAPDALDRPAAPDARHEDVELPAGLAPQLGAVYS